MWRAIKKNLLIFGYPTIYLLIGIEFGLFILIFFFKNTNNYDKTIEIGVNAVLMLVATILGIFIPLQISRNQKKADDRKTMAFTLSFIWGELRMNRHIINQLIVNYTFKEIIETSTIDKLIPALLPLLKSTCKQTEFLSQSSYIASQQSGGITTLDDDDLLNDLNQVYENYLYFKDAINTALENVLLKNFVIITFHPQITTYENEEVRNELKNQLNIAYRDLLYCKDLTNIAIDSIVCRINHLGANLTDEIREVDSSIDLFAKQDSTN